MKHLRVLTGFLAALTAVMFLFCGDNVIQVPGDGGTAGGGDPNKQGDEVTLAIGAPKRIGNNVSLFISANKAVKAFYRISSNPSLPADTKNEGSPFNIVKGGETYEWEIPIELRKSLANASVYVSVVAVDAKGVIISNDAQSRSQQTRPDDPKAPPAIVLIESDITNNVATVVFYSDKDADGFFRISKNRSEAGAIILEPNQRLNIVDGKNTITYPVPTNLQKEYSLYLSVVGINEEGEYNYESWFSEYVYVESGSIKPFNATGTAVWTETPGKAQLTITADKNIKAIKYYVINAEVNDEQLIRDYGSNGPTLTAPLSDEVIFTISDVKGGYYVNVLVTSENDETAVVVTKPGAAVVALDLTQGDNAVGGSGKTGISRTINSAEIFLNVTGVVYDNNWRTNTSLYVINSPTALTGADAPSTTDFLGGGTVVELDYSSRPNYSYPLANLGYDDEKYVYFQAIDPTKTGAASVTLGVKVEKFGVTVPTITDAKWTRTDVDNATISFKISTDYTRFEARYFKGPFDGSLSTNDDKIAHVLASGTVISLNASTPKDVSQSLTVTGATDYFVVVTAYPNFTLAPDLKINSALETFSVAAYNTSEPTVVVTVTRNSSNNLETTVESDLPGKIYYQIRYTGDAGSAPSDLTGVSELSTWTEWTSGSAEDISEPVAPVTKTLASGSSNLGGGKMYVSVVTTAGSNSPAGNFNGTFSTGTNGITDIPRVFPITSEITRVGVTTTTAGFVHFDVSDAAKLTQLGADQFVLVKPVADDGPVVFDEKTDFPHVASTTALSAGFWDGVTPTAYPTGAQSVLKSALTYTANNKFVYLMISGADGTSTISGPHAIPAFKAPVTAPATITGDRINATSGSFSFDLGLTGTATWEGKVVYRTRGPAETTPFLSTDVLTPTAPATNASFSVARKNADNKTVTVTGLTTVADEALAVDFVLVEYANSTVPNDAEYQNVTSEAGTAALAANIPASMALTPVPSVSLTERHGALNTAKVSITTSGKLKNKVFYTLTNPTGATLDDAEAFSKHDGINWKTSEGSENTTLIDFASSELVHGATPAPLSFYYIVVPYKYSSSTADADLDFSKAYVGTQGTSAYATSTDLIPTPIAAKVAGTVTWSASEGTWMTNGSSTEAFASGEILSYTFTAGTETTAPTWTSSWATKTIRASDVTEGGFALAGGSVGQKVWYVVRSSAGGLTTYSLVSTGSHVITAQ